MAPMAEVLQPLISTITPSGMLQTRPASAEAFQPGMSQQHASGQQHNRAASMPRSLQHGARGPSPSAAPTYAFNENRSPSASSSPYTSSTKPLGPADTNRYRHQGSMSVSQPANPASSWSQTLFSKDDSVLSRPFEVAPFTTASPAIKDADAPLAKPSPDRYHRGGPRRTDSSNSIPSLQDNERPGSSKQHSPASAISHTDTVAGERPSSPSPNNSTIRAVDQNGSSSPKFENPTSMKRYRRRSQQPPEDAVKLEPEVVRPASSSGASSRAAPPRFDSSNGPARSFADVARRTVAPSPLSRPMSPGDSPGKAPGSALQNSPAVAAMAALSEKESQKGMKHKIRRAFSFGSTAEMKRVAEADDAALRAQARRDQFSTELDEEQDAIARQQEAAGLGHNIYSGQAGFVGSTDNISISSTASSASMMLRKMGRGMKKGGRSIKGLFRPKSVVGVPAADGPVASVGPVSMVTVEAEREKVNVNADPHEQIGGGTGFPRLDRNSIDAASRTAGDSEDSRKSIIGGDNDRQEVLAAVKRGILKRTATAPPNGMAEGDEVHGSIAPAGDYAQADGYFASLPPRFNNHSSRSLPGTPGSSTSRNIKFSPRIIFHDVWSATDYDRRGDIATCNRLTPMLAQQIKEELNTFKMEMEVHELSKPHTHFF